MSSGGQIWMALDTGMRKGYPSDVSREQFELVRPLLESARRKTAPRRVDLYEVFCAVLYLLRTGCSRSGHHEEVRETVGHQAEVRARARSPFLRQSLPVLSLEVDAKQRTGQGVEPRREDASIGDLSVRSGSGETFRLASSCPYRLISHVRRPECRFSLEIKGTGHFID